MLGYFLPSSASHGDKVSATICTRAKIQGLRRFIVARNVRRGIGPPSALEFYGRKNIRQRFAPPPNLASTVPCGRMEECCQGKRCSKPPFSILMGLLSTRCPRI